jgi:glycosyltransferase involved in cell wall biosynthesis
MELIRRLGIERQVVWLKPPRTFGFTRHEMMAIYAAAGAVADDFALGWFGSIVIEGLASSKPTICYVDEEAMRTMYAWHPILSTNTPDGVAAILGRLAGDDELRRTMGAKGRQWIRDFHSPEAAAAAYAERLMHLHRRAQTEDHRADHLARGSRVLK